MNYMKVNQSKTKNLVLIYKILKTADSQINKTKSPNLR